MLDADGPNPPIPLLNTPVFDGLLPIEEVEEEPGVLVYIYQRL